MPDLFEQLKQKYQPVLDTIQKEGAQLQNLNVDGNQLNLKATATSEASKNRIWDAINYQDAIQLTENHYKKSSCGNQPVRGPIPAHSLRRPEKNLHRVDVHEVQQQPEDGSRADDCVERCRLFWRPF